MRRRTGASTGVAISRLVISATGFHRQRGAVASRACNLGWQPQRLASIVALRLYDRLSDTRPLSAALALRAYDCATGSPPRIHCQLRCADAGVGAGMPNCSRLAISATGFHRQRGAVALRACNLGWQSQRPASIVALRLYDRLSDAHPLSAALRGRRGRLACLRQPGHTLRCATAR